MMLAQKLQPPRGLAAQAQQLLSCKGHTHAQVYRHAAATAARSDREFSTASLQQPDHDYFDRAAEGSSTSSSSSGSRRRAPPGAALGVPTDPTQTGYLPGKGTPQKMKPPLEKIPFGSSGEPYPVHTGIGLAGRAQNGYQVQQYPKSAGQNHEPGIPTAPILPEGGASVLSSPCYDQGIGGGSSLSSGESAEVVKGGAEVLRGQQQRTSVEKMLPPVVNPNAGKFALAWEGKEEAMDPYHECWTVHGGMVIGAEQYEKAQALQLNQTAARGAENSTALPGYKGKLIEEDFEVSGVTGAVVARKFKGIERPGGGIADGHPEVAPGWFQFENREGRKWYLHPWSGRTQWKHPASGEIDASPVSWFYKRPADDGLPGRPWFAYLPRNPVATLSQDRVLGPIRQKMRWWIYSHQAWFFYCLMLVGPIRCMQPETFGNGYEAVKAPTQRELDWGRGSALIPSEKFENWVYSTVYGLLGYDDYAKSLETDETRLRKYSFDCMEESFWYKHHIDFETGKVTEPRKRMFNFVRLETD